VAEGQPGFSGFDGWADGYAALTYAWRDKERIANYIKNQREHHKQTDFVSEYRRLREEQGIRIGERFFP
jgi:uncharacterized membrane protein YgaE (UPF0421/DUF939 family)